MNYWPEQQVSSAPGPARSPGLRPGRGRDTDGPGSDDIVSERAARLTLTMLAGSVIVLMIGVVVFFTVKSLRERERVNDAPVIEGPAPTTPEDAARVLGGIGPPPGADVVSYTNTRKEVLAQATGDRIAVVSLSSYTTEAKARATVGSVEVVALLAAAPGGQPAVVTGGLAAWANSQTADARAERDEIRKLIPTAQSDPAFQAFYRSEVDRLTKLINGIRPDGNVVFGLVVRAPAPALQQLGAKTEIRLVDVGPTADPPATPEYRGLRPEENSKANEPNTRPA